MRSQRLLEVNNLSVHFETYDGVVKVLQDVTFRIDRNRWTGLVGETGCGKSVTAFSIIKLLPISAKVVGGNIFFKGADLIGESEKSLRRMRGSEISMIFQDPSVAINPSLKIGNQVTETIRIHQNVSRISWCG